jgi:hypothetical protein
MLSAHLSVKEFFPNPAFWVMGAGFIVVACTVWLLVRKDNFGFFLIVFFCSHFAFADNQGGLWSYVVCAVFVITALLGHRSGISLSAVPGRTNILVMILFTSQFFGTIINPYGLIANIQATVVAVSQLLIFYFVASQKITSHNMKRLLSVCFLVVAWEFVIGVNQRYHWLITRSPLLPQMYRKEGVIASTPLGSFGNSELFSEYFCMALVLALVIVIHIKDLEELQAGLFRPLLICFMAPVAMILGTSRAAIILAVASICMIAAVNFLAVPSLKTMKRAVVLFSTLFVVGTAILAASSFISLDAITEKFSKLNPSKIDSGSIISGKGINRDTAYNAAFARFNSESWILGYGYNLPEKNTASMGLRKGSADFHSLYLSLPIYYGWIGAAAFVLILVGAAFRSFFYYMKYRKLDHWLVPFALGITVAWGVFILDEYKITVTRNPSYFFLFWMWLGLTHAVMNSLRNKGLEQ